MPELPEVHTTVEGLKKTVKGKKIKAVWTDYNSPFHRGKENIKNPKYFAKFTEKIIGQKITDVDRKGKHILIRLGNESTIVTHMKMTGHFLYGKYEHNKKKDSWSALSPAPLKDPFSRFVHFLITLNDNSHLAFSDMRKFAHIRLLEKNEKLSDIEALGKDALFDTHTWQEIKSAVSCKPFHGIKTDLLDQERIAGIGNIYSDEILWKAGVMPERKTDSVTDSEWKKIHKATKAILKKSIEVGGDSMSDYRNIHGERGGFQNCHKAYRQTGKKCSKKNCGGIIKRSVVGGRSTHYCTIHQI